MYKKILLAYDGTREGLIALREGALLAMRFKAQVFLLSVVPETAGVRVASSVQGDVVGQQIENYKAVLKRAVEVARELGLDPVARLEIGEPAPRIAAFANEIGADLIVVGHRRQGALARWWTGVTGSYISDLVSCSVLVACNAISDEAFEAALHSAGEGR